MLREKLLGGKLRKHSEQLNKFVAGFFDSDGSVFVYKDRSSLGLRSCIVQSASKDPDFEVMRALQRHYGLGRLTYSTPEKGSAMIEWSMSAKDSKIFFSLIGKHLCIKATHFDNMIWLWDNCRSLGITEDIEDFKRCSRKSSKYFKKPKHLSWAYTAGYIAGDGHLQCRKHKRPDRPRDYYIRKSVIVASGDEIIVDLFKESFKGNKTYSDRDHTWRWERSLGLKNKKFSDRFLRKIRPSMLLITKRDVIDRLLELPAETECNRPGGMRQSTPQ